MARHSFRASTSGASRLSPVALAIVLAASPAFAVSLDLTSATVAQQGEVAQICVNLSTGGEPVAGTQNDLVWDETCATLATKGNCAASPGLGKQLQSSMPNGDGHPPLRAFILSLSDVEPIGDTQLYCCSFRSELNEPGSCCNIALTRLGASTPDGRALRTTTSTGAGSPILCLRGSGGSSAGGFVGGGAIGGVNTGGFNTATSDAGNVNTGTGNTGTGNTGTGNTGASTASGTGNTGGESTGGSTTGAGSTTESQGAAAPQGQTTAGRAGGAQQLAGQPGAEEAVPNNQVAQQEAAPVAPAPQQPRMQQPGAASGEAGLAPGSRPRAEEGQGAAEEGQGTPERAAPTTVPTAVPTPPAADTPTAKPAPTPKPTAPPTAAPTPKSEGLWGCQIEAGAAGGPAVALAWLGFGVFLVVLRRRHR
jgi:hypothetical protein